MAEEQRECGWCDQRGRRVKAKRPGSSKVIWVCEICRGPWYPK